jgi:hypothetical protein
VNTDVVIGIGGDSDIDDLAPRLGELLDVRFEERESGQYGGGSYYRARPDGDEELRLYRNFDPVDGTSLEAEEYAALLRLLFTERDPDRLAEGIASALGHGADVVRRRT